MQEKNKITPVQEQIYKMLTQNTGRALCDSGGYPKYDENGKYTGSEQGYGRHYERNQCKTIEDFINEPEVSFTWDWGYTISVFHYTTKQLDLDELCLEFNQLECLDFDGPGYGVSIAQNEWLQERGYEIIDKGYNTYNGDSNLSQVLQYTVVREKDSLNEEGDYILLQTHNGTDIRGGYSDAKLFIPISTISNYGYAGLAIEDVYGTLYRGKLIIPISNMYDGYRLRVDGQIEVEEDPNQLKLFDIDDLEMTNPKLYKEYEEIVFKEDDVVKLHLMLD
jgi:hypothetical protein